eukprot:jgi/Mesvir1/23475/Mv22324-RA.1
MAIATNQLCLGTVATPFGLGGRLCCRSFSRRKSSNTAAKSPSPRLAVAGLSDNEEGDDAWRAEMAVLKFRIERLREKEQKARQIVHLLSSGTRTGREGQWPVNSSVAAMSSDSTWDEDDEYAHDGRGNWLATSVVFLISLYTFTALVNVLASAHPFHGSSGLVTGFLHFML